LHHHLVNQQQHARARLNLMAQHFCRAAIPTRLAYCRTALCDALWRRVYYFQHSPARSLLPGFLPLSPTPILTDAIAVVRVPHLPLYLPLIRFRTAWRATTGTRHTFCERRGAARAPLCDASFYTCRTAPRARTGIEPARIQSPLFRRALRRGQRTGDVHAARRQTRLLLFSTR